MAIFAFSWCFLAAIGNGNLYIDEPFELSNQSIFVVDSNLYARAYSAAIGQNTKIDVDRLSTQGHAFLTGANSAKYASKIAVTVDDSAIFCDGDNSVCFFEIIFVLALV